MNRLYLVISVSGVSRKSKDSTKTAQEGFYEPESIKEDRPIWDFE